MSSAKRWLVVVLFLSATGCSRRLSPAVDDAVVAYLSRARSAHVAADIAEDEGDRTRAVTALEALLSAPLPHPNNVVPEVDEVLADANARIADLSVQTKNFPRAHRAVDEGLTHVPSAGYYRGHLFEVKGALLAAEAKAADAEGRPGEATTLRQAARDALKEAVRLQEAVILQTGKQK